MENKAIEYLIIDTKMRKIEKDFFLQKGYNLIELKKQDSVYEEISSHPDIFFTKINDKVIVEPSVYEKCNNIIKNECIKGCSFVRKNYPNDINYNVCIIGKNAIHNFKFTDKVVQKMLKGYNLINVNQGYSKCSVCVLNNNACITSDISIYNEIKKNNINKNNLVIDVIYVKEENIKLIKNNSYSDMSGFIGGATAVIDNTLVIFGDINKLESKEKIKEFTKKHNMKIKDFEGIDVIDYGGIILI